MLYSCDNYYMRVVQVKSTPYVHLVKNDFILYVEVFYGIAGITGQIFLETGYTS